ncbi:hypothetical protein KGA66_21465 [Actinocrinis puniceicyclus]|uniref:Uncharacterized protein n=1 Tax=Actinocrinis puniceicyclus TaxID=977794 RepID=A0A8J8BGC8_9ACTN|nr:hypothetical protein [Actinocrinis puniceicyclus]MBS2965634.1 hypothetical protein [Actinocrinis puniceicyclus]
MSDATAAEWLWQEALDHLEADSLGVYELLWLLRGSDYQLPEQQARALAQSTASLLLAEGKARIVRLRWPTNEEVDDTVDASVLLEQTAFEPDEEGVYLALVAPDDDR